MSGAPVTLEGWFVLHEMWAVDWPRWNSLGSADRDAVLLEATALLETQARPPEGHSAWWSLLTQKGSLYVTRPTLATYTANRAELEATAQELFDAVMSGKVSIEVSRTYALSEARQVHADLENRRTTGSVVMVPCS